MTVVKTLNHLQKWFKEKVCSQIKLKCPPLENDIDTDDYEYNLVTPACFAHSIPASDKLPPNFVSNTPCLCVQILSGADNVAKKDGSMMIQVSLSVWNTGEHKKDRLFESDEGFKADNSGWTDVLNFLDITRLELKKTINFELDNTESCIEIDKSEPIEYGYFTDKGMVMPHPMWAAYLKFGISYKITGDTGGGDFLYN